MAKTKALSDNQRTIIGFVVTAVIASVIYIQTLPEDQRPPVWVMAVLGGVIIVAQLAKDQFGVRDATSARIAKEVSEAYPQHRELPTAYKGT